MMEVGVARGPVDELQPAETGHQVPRRGLVPVAAVVMRVVEGLVIRDLPLDLARLGIQAEGEVVLEVGHPDQALQGEHVGRVAPAPRGTPAGPHCLAGVGGEGVQGAAYLPPVDPAVGVELGEVDRPVVVQERAHVGDADVVPHLVLGHLGPGHAPGLAAVGQVQADDLVAVDEEHAAAACGHAQMADRLHRAGLGAQAHVVAGLPPHLSGRGVDGGDPLAHGRRRIARFVARFLRPLVDGNDERAVYVEDLVGQGRGLEGPQDLAGGGVEFGQRRVEAERGVDAIAGRHETSRHVRGDGEAAGELGAPRAPAPFGHRHTPQREAVEGVAGHQRPLVRRGARHARGGLVHDVEQPAARRHDRRHAGNAVVRPRPQGPGHPLEASRRPGHRVARHGVAVRPVQPVRPLVDVGRLGLDGLLAANQRHAARDEHAQDLDHADAARAL